MQRYTTTTIVDIYNRFDWVQTRFDITIIVLWQLNICNEKNVQVHNVLPPKKIRIVMA